MPKLWKLSPSLPSDLSQKLSQYPQLLRQLLFNRELTEPDKIEEFLNPRYENLHSPFLFADMQKAVERIWQAIDNREKICIYGDYDADAVTANAVLRQTFKYLGHENVESYIPDRFTEGYGVNLDALLKIKDQGSKIIITVDCGTNSTDAADFCRAHNLDFIITDHHEIIGEKPQALALINPKNHDDKYPYSEITGVGVAFKLACAILMAAEKRGSLTRKSAETVNPEWAKWLLDLVAIGTVADCHSLLGENRILVKYGLKVLAKTRWVGLRALMSSAGLDAGRPLDTYTLGFILAPRLNAAGRLEHANIALEVLLETDSAGAAAKSANLELINRRRQDLTERVLSEAREQALLLAERKILVVWGEDWPKGVVGLAAGKLAEEFYKPTIVLEKSGSLSTGSARTVGGFNIIEALKSAAPHLERFGGHQQAAGLSLKPEKIGDFYQAVLSYADANMPAEQPERVLALEAGLSAEELSIDTCRLVGRLEPFGVDNHKPKFLIGNLSVASARIVGRSAKHLQLRLRIGGREVAAIYFNAPEVAKTLQMGDNVDVACELTEDGYNGRAEVKLRVVDIKKILI